MAQPRIRVERVVRNVHVPNRLPNFNRNPTGLFGVWFEGEKKKEKKKKTFLDSMVNVCCALTNMFPTPKCCLEPCDLVFECCVLSEFKLCGCMYAEHHDCVPVMSRVCGDGGYCSQCFQHSSKQNSIAQPKTDTWLSSPSQFSSFNCCLSVQQRGLPRKFACRIFVLTNRV